MLRLPHQLAPAAAAAAAQTDSSCSSAANPSCCNMTSCSACHSSWHQQLLKKTNSSCSSLPAEAEQPEYCLPHQSTPAAAQTDLSCSSACCQLKQNSQYCLPHRSTLAAAQTDLSCSSACCQLEQNSPILSATPINASCSSD
jgi:hypothetical protein